MGSAGGGGRVWNDDGRTLRATQQQPPGRRTLACFLNSLKFKLEHGPTVQYGCNLKLFLVSGSAPIEIDRCRRSVVVVRLAVGVSTRGSNERRDS